MRLVGTRSRTRSRAIRHRTSEKGEHLVKLMGKNLSSDRSALAETAKRSVETYSAGRTGSASLPAPAKWLGPIASMVHTNDSTLTRNKGLLVSPLRTLLGQECPCQTAVSLRLEMKSLHARFYSIAWLLWKLVGANPRSKPPEKLKLAESGQILSRTLCTSFAVFVQIVINLPRSDFPHSYWGG
jgi:hypothetical protein